ncbi:hypothetical protein AYM40_20810 [Paraburkholderia phytofirmans OLGA172]|uniref:Uncharacterized protein n=1 Tax=Paraburkholderia phytofirmans OLGA172 TaxID=1417228 RepID=A0A160FQF7_9BURK|nr:hypothetical protein AYM40_20810 [Paraburkholderia phytofirmans OLGA172]
MTDEHGRAIFFVHGLFGACNQMRIPGRLTGLILAKAEASMTVSQAMLRLAIRLFRDNGSLNGVRESLARFSDALRTAKLRAEYIDC